MPKQTIKHWVVTLREKFATKEEFKADLDRVIKELEEDKESAHQLKFYNAVKNKLAKIEERLEQLRVEIINERISMGEIIELQTLAMFIDDGDVQLLQWAGVKEFEE